MRYVTNNPTRLAQDYAAKLTALGVPTHPDEVITSVTATTMWLRENHPTAAVYPIGEPPLIEALRQGGVRLSSDPAEIDLVLASFDRTFTYEKLQIAFDALWFHKRAILVATNPDKFCPYPGGRGEPDAAAIIAAIEASTGVGLSRTFGKPSRILPSRPRQRGKGARPSPMRCRGGSARNGHRDGHRRGHGRGARAHGRLQPRRSPLLPRPTHPCDRGVTGTARLRRASRRAR